MDTCPTTAVIRWRRWLSLIPRAPVRYYRHWHRAGSGVIAGKRSARIESGHSACGRNRQHVYMCLRFRQCPNWTHRRVHFQRQVWSSLYQCFGTKF